MYIPKNDFPVIPEAPRGIQKGVPLKNLLGSKSINYLARNISNVYPQFDAKEFQKLAQAEIEALGLMDRAKHIAIALHKFLPKKYEDAVNIILDSLTPPQIHAEQFGLAEFFYLPHSFYISEYGQSEYYNDGIDPFEVSMKAQYELTQRFTSEFSIRPFLVNQQDRTLSKIMNWLNDPNPHVRRFCSEGTRPRLPWGIRIPSFIINPAPLIPILDTLKDDESLYVRRSVANNLGDIAKDNPDMVFQLCNDWLRTASRERKWLIRHAVRYPANKGNKIALDIRVAAS